MWLVLKVLASLALAIIIGCAGRSSRRDAWSISVAPPPGDSCPSLPDSSATPPAVDSMGPIRIRDGPVHDVHVSIVIDGRWAAWNDGRSLGPDLDPDDVASVEIVKPPAARTRYGTCPGVGLIVVTTKSKKWRPYAGNEH